MPYDFKEYSFAMLINYYCPYCGKVNKTMFATSEEPNLQKILEDKNYDLISNTIIAVEDTLCEQCKNVGDTNSKN